MVEPFTSKALRSTGLQMFYVIGVLERLCKIHRKTLMLELLFNKITPKETLSRLLSHDFCEIFKNTL